MTTQTSGFYIFVFDKVYQFHSKYAPVYILSKYDICLTCVFHIPTSSLSTCQPGEASSRRGRCWHRDGLDHRGCTHCSGATAAQERRFVFRPRVLRRVHHLPYRFAHQYRVRRSEIVFHEIAFSGVLYANGSPKIDSCP